MARPPGAGWLLSDFNLKRLSRNPRSIFSMSVSHRGRGGDPTMGSESADHSPAAL